MKKKIFIILLVVVVASIAFAQGWDRWGDNPWFQPAETVKVSGALVVAQGMPAIKSGDTTYLLNGLSRLAGFIDGLKEGAQVTIEGSAVTARGDGTTKFLRPETLLLGGKTYDLAQAFSPGYGFSERHCAPGNFGRGYGPGCGYSDRNYGPGMGRRDRQEPRGPGRHRWF